MMMMINTESF